MNAHCVQKKPHNFNEIFQAKEESGKYPMEKCQSEH